MGASLIQSTPASATEAALEQHQYLTFMLGGEIYAIGILHIKEIIEHGHVTAMPMMPEFIRGVINLRGRAVPVIDLGVRFGGSSTPLGKRTCIVILEIEREGESQDVGVVVDAVNEVLEIQREEIESAPDFGSSVRTGLIKGMGNVNGRFVVILDVDCLFSIDELSLVGKLSEPEGEVDESPVREPRSG